MSDTENALAPVAGGLTWERVRETWLGGMSDNTARAYDRQVRRFCRWFGEEPTAAVSRFLSLPSGEAHKVALDWRNSLIGEGLSSATVNQALAALRSLVRIARVLGWITWALDVPGLKVEAYRDTRGPAKITVRRMLDDTMSRADFGDHPIDHRDYAILRLLTDLALRRGEVVSLDVSSFEPREGDRPARLHVLGKGRRDRVVLTLPDETEDAILTWLEVRAEQLGEPGEGAPMFVSASPGRELTTRRARGKLVWYVVRKLADRLGMTGIRPHGIRHAAITKALDDASGDVRAVQRFSRHANVETLLRYDDARQDLAGEVAAKVASSW